MKYLILPPLAVIQHDGEGKMLGGYLERMRRTQIVKARFTDIARWSRPENLSRNWDMRAAFAAAHCADSEAVCDIGCGNQALRKMLPRHVRYLPADIVARNHETAVCDLNSKQLPGPYLAEADTATLLGVIEYINDLPWLFNALAQRVQKLIVSYNPSDTCRAPRDEMGWVNSYRTEELASLIVESGFCITDVTLVNEGQILIVGRTVILN